MSETPHNSAQSSFGDLAGWAEDDHGAAFAAFRRSCEKITAVAAARMAAGREPGDEITPLLGICGKALAEANPLPRRAARAFFERYFTPRRVASEAGTATGFLTGYFEPELEGSREPSDRFAVPVLAKPDDLVPLVPDVLRAAHNDGLTAGRQTPAGVVAYATREEIEKGALDGRGLEILYLADRFDAYIMHVQGSGRVLLADGSVVRLAYAGKNGHPYSSIGKVLIDRGEIARDEMSLEALESWARRNPAEAEALMWHNRSYIFFRELGDFDQSLGPLGAQGVALTPGRSLAVDASVHALGTPIWVAAEELESETGADFRRLMIAQDVGSAIRGPERGDIFWGSGAVAGKTAGVTRHRGRFWTLVPRAATSGD